MLDFQYLQFLEILVIYYFRNPLSHEGGFFLLKKTENETRNLKNGLKILFIFPKVLFFKIPMTPSLP
jgi:hypothetical protein